MPWRTNKETRFVISISWPTGPPLPARRPKGGAHTRCTKGKSAPRGRCWRRGGFLRASPLQHSAISRCLFRDDIPWLAFRKAASAAPPEMPASLSWVDRGVLGRLFLILRAGQIRVQGQSPADCPFLIGDVGTPAAAASSTGTSTGTQHQHPSPTAHCESSHLASRISHLAVHAE